MCVVDYWSVLVAAKDGFNGNVFSSIDALNHLRRNRISSPQVRRVSRDTGIAPVINLSGLVRIQQPKGAAGKKSKSALKTGVAS